MTNESQPCQYHSRCELAFHNKYGGCLGGPKWISLEGFMESAHGLVCLDWDVIVPEATKPAETTQNSPAARIPDVVVGPDRHLPKDWRGRVIR